MNQESLKPERQTDDKKRKRRWMPVVLGLLFLLIVVFAAGYFYANSFAAGKIKAQLGDLGMGEPDVGSVSIGLGGVTANDISFTDEQGRRIDVQKLTIEHPIAGLVAGDTVYQKITLDGVDATVPLNFSDEASPIPAIDISTLQLPAKSLQLKNAHIDLQSPGKPDYQIRSINVNIETKADQLIATGTIEEFAGGEWNVDGVITPAQNQMAVELKTDGLTIANNQWQQWPLVPAGMDKTIQANATLDARVVLRLPTPDNDQTDGTQSSKIQTPEIQTVEIQPRPDAVASLPIDYAVELDIQNADLQIVPFDLPVEIKHGRVSASAGVIEYQNVVATIDQQDNITVDGNTNVNSFPITTKFEADAESLSTASLRKLVPAIPDVVTGRGDGRASGTIAIEPSLRTTVTLQAEAESTNGRYASIAATKALATVSIKPLIFDETFAFESLDGQVIVNANTEDQPVKAVFDAFDLQSLNQQLEIVADGTGSMALTIPLATASAIDTWKMAFDATADQASVSGRKLDDVKIKAVMSDGNLRFTKIEAVPVRTAKLFSDKRTPAIPTQDSFVSLTVDWPISKNAAHPQTGKLAILGRQTPPTWVADVLLRQIKNSQPKPSGNDDAPPIIPNEIAQSMEDIEGALNFQANIDIPVASPDAIDGWIVKGNVTDSRIAVQNNNLSGIGTDITIEQGVLSINNLAGQFNQGGRIGGNARLNILKGDVSAAELIAEDVPAAWLAAVAAQRSPGLRKFLERSLTRAPENDVPENDGATIETAIDGYISAQLTFEPSLENAADTDDAPWLVKTQVRSKTLTFNQVVLDNLSIKGEYDGQRIAVVSAKAKVASKGELSATGDYDLSTENGKANVQWQQLPFDWLARVVTSDTMPLGGSTDGTLDLAILPTAPNATAGQFPFDISGSVEARDLQYEGFKTRAFGFSLRTDGDKVLLEKFHADDLLDGIDVGGHVVLTPPFQFRGRAKISTLPLSRVFALPSVADRLQTVKDITGIADATATIDGNLSNLNLETAGKLSIDDLAIDGKRLSPIRAHWNHVDGDWSKSKATLQAFGGEVVMTELVRDADRVKVEMTDIEAQELSTLIALPFKIDGAVSGDAEINEWDVAEARWSSINFKSASMLIAGTEFGDVGGAVTFRDQTLSYSLDGRLLDGQLKAEGTQSVDFDQFDGQTFPMEIQFTNGNLQSLIRSSSTSSTLRPLAGKLAGRAEVIFSINGLPTARGKIEATDVAWQGKLLTRELSSDVTFNGDVANFSNLRADLKQGEISGQASVPMASNGTGSYRLAVRKFDLQRLSEVLMQDPIEGFGVVDARITGQLGNRVTGQGTLAINQADLLGQTGRTFRVPVQFRYNPLQQRGRFEVRQSRFQLFGGNASGTAALEFGTSLNLETDLQLSNIDTDTLFSSLAGVNNSGQGDLSGHLVLRGRAIRSPRDLKGFFTGSLDQTSALQIPLLNTLSRFLGGNQLQGQNFSSDEIDVRLSSGRLDVRQLNLSSSLVQISITGDVFVDGRLDLDVAARVDRLNQPTLLDQIAGSPLANLTGTPAAVFAQAAEFLSERLVFLKVTGTANRPIIRPEAGKQLRAEAIRHFLRGTQILPTGNSPNN